MVTLGVNVDHVATVREARKTYEPDPVWAAALAELGGADGITIHLREDRRHIQNRDLQVMRETVAVKLNLELACAEDVLAIATETRPDQATLVPESRAEVTTEGGLDVVGQYDSVAPAVERLQSAGIPVALFLDPSLPQIEAGAKLGVQAIELHTGSYALAKGNAQARELETLRTASQQIRQLGIQLHAGHGLTYQNVQAVAAFEGMEELNIGHSIISRALLTGIETAVREMKRLIENAGN